MDGSQWTAHDGQLGNGAMDGLAMLRWMAPIGRLAMDGSAMGQWKARDRLLAMDGSAHDGRLSDGALYGSQWMARRWSAGRLMMDGVAMDCACNGLCDRAWQVGRLRDGWIVATLLSSSCKYFKNDWVNGDGRK